MKPDFAGTVFGAAAGEFARWSGRLWRPLGEISVAAVRPRPGDRVLDACCGAGASALPAAAAVGPDGRVDAVDVAAGLLEQGRAEARVRGLGNVRFAEHDVLTWDGEYDLVQCGYGVFFFPDMDAGARRLVSLLRPGGRFAVTTWRHDGMARVVPIGMAAAVPERPELAAHVGDPGPAGRIDRPETLAAWMTSLGLTGVTVAEIRFVQPFHSADAWSFYLGAAMRAFVGGLDEAALARVRDRFVAGLAEAGVTELDASTLVAVGATRS
ncbi:class I SAM-dependent methyltransferase [Amycolatopsis suaedae]|uniref:Methyltransferase domain-containing protein n=1 Tax=Amycolatopsis suaedae TaxID=2510978 RepID=A0A4Q7J7U5_9PSEU|nr:class I SAM-dependent methyltransferase [Amycolatopsis suaedae]RZQ63751.1 methyltransferase domain-containing protein [Amycolatopsis suaedae]